MTRLLSSALGIAVVSLLVGCGGKSIATPKPATNIDRSLELQIAVRSKPYQAGDEINDGEFRVLASNVLPIHSTGGPGGVLSETDGVLVEIAWSGVRLLGNDELRLTDFRWTIHNQLVEHDGSRTIGWQGPSTQVFHSEYTPLLAPVSLRHTQEELSESPMLVIRGRQVCDARTSRDIALEE